MDVCTAGRDGGYLLYCVWGFEGGHHAADGGLSVSFVDAGGDCPLVFLPGGVKRGDAQLKRVQLSREKGGIPGKYPGGDQAGERRVPPFDLLIDPFIGLSDYGTNAVGVLAAAAVLYGRGICPVPGPVLHYVVDHGVF